VTIFSFGCMNVSVGLNIFKSSDKEKNVRECLCRVDDDYQDRLLACGAIIVAQVRVRVLEETQFTCSAGIAHNKVYNVSQ
jgi:nucleotidyltransferase/DNA polymerase involved in DNA repair